MRSCIFFSLSCLERDFGMSSVPYLWSNRSRRSWWSCHATEFLDLLLILLSYSRPPNTNSHGLEKQITGGLIDMLSFPPARIMYTNIVSLTGSLFQTPGGGGNKGGGGGDSRQQGSNLFKTSFGSRSKEKITQPTR